MHPQAPTRRADEAPSCTSERRRVLRPPPRPGASAGRRRRRHERAEFVPKPPQQRVPYAISRVVAGGCPGRSRPDGEASSSDPASGHSVPIRPPIACQSPVMVQKRRRAWNVQERPVGTAARRRNACTTAEALRSCIRASVVQVNWPWRPGAGAGCREERVLAASVGCQPGWVIDSRSSFSSSCSSVSSPRSTYPRSITASRTVMPLATECLAILAAAS